MGRRLLAFAPAALLALVSPGAGAAPDARAATAGVTAWPLASAVTTLHLDEDALARHGLRVGPVEASAPTPPTHPLSFLPPDQPSFRALPSPALRVRVADGTARAFAGGPVVHAGGFALEGPAGRVDFSGFALRAGGRPFALDLLDGAGEPLLAAVQPWLDVDPASGLLRLINADLRILPALARRLGEPRLAGATIGSLELRGTLRTGATGLRAFSAGSSVPSACEDFSGQVDVALIAMDSVEQVGSPRDGRLVVAPSVTLKNVGTANVPWYTKFSGSFPPHGNDQHPYLVWQMLRLHEGVLEPLGRNDLKHAFATANFHCDPGACNTPNGHVLGLGCEDPYNIGSNTWLSALAPRSEVSAWTGIWAHCDEPVAGTASHLDPDGDCDQDTPPGEDRFTHGLAVAHDALGVPGARYFLEAFYIVRGDVNVLNSMGYREVVPAFGGSWTFPFAGTFRQGPVIDLWVDRTAPGPAADHVFLATGEGRVQVAVRVTPRPGGRHRYAIAVHNHDFDRRVASLHLPFDTTGISDISFADGDANGDNDWLAVVDGAGVTWTAPAGNELDWGTLFAFRFDTASPFGELALALGVADPGTPGAPDELVVALCDPAIPFCGAPAPFFSDGFESGGTGSWSGKQP